MLKAIGLFLGVLFLTIGWHTASYAKVYFTKEEALRLVFPEATAIEKKTVFLDSEQQKEIERLSKAKLEGKIFTFYIGKKDNTILGYALFGTHTIRTKPEVYIVAINPNGSLKQVEILAFYEPQEYLPTKRWFKQFIGKFLDDDLRLKRGIDAISGATLSAQGIISEARKVLAIFNITIQQKNEISNQR